MVNLEKMKNRTINGANYTTSVNGMIHPDRVMKEHDFLYILEGSWEIREERETYRLQTDDLLILTAGRHHFGEKPCNPGNRHMYFHVLPTEAEKKYARVEHTQREQHTQSEHTQMEYMQIEQHLQTAGAMQAANSQENHAESAASPSFLTCGSLIHCGDNHQIRQYFQDVVDTYWSQDPEKDNRMTLNFNLLLCELSRMLPEHEQYGAKDFVVEQAIRKMHSDPRRFWSAQEMADEFFICARTLNNRFRKATGKTFSAYQMDLRLGMVREFLQNQPDARLREAAVNFGFYDEFHMSKAFKKKYGISPSKVRG